MRSAHKDKINGWLRLGRTECRSYYQRKQYRSVVNDRMIDKYFSNLRSYSSVNICYDVYFFVRF